jgi:hypothetical protein
MSDAVCNARQAGAGGYATATMLVIIAIIGSTALWSYRETLTGRTLANARLFQARAAVLAGSGLQAATQRLRNQPQAAGLSWRQPAAANNEQTEISTRLLRTESLPAGFSADRFIEYHHEVISTASSGLGARVTQTMGLALLNTAMPGVDTAAACPSTQALHVRVRVGGYPGTQPITGLLLAGVAPTLMIADADTGQVVWSAGPTVVARQRLFDDRTTITASLAVLDTDSDGLHDRIYAGDHAGRIWRLDLHNGNVPEQFASGGVFADLPDAGGQRAFLAAPDVSLGFDPAVGTSWLNISIGTALSPRANRLFVLRDYAARRPWSEIDYQRWRPIREQDLRSDRAHPEAASPPGYYVDLGTAQVFTPSITIDRKVTYAVAQTAVRTMDGCSTGVSIRGFDIADGTSPQVTALGEAAAGIPIRVLREADARNQLRIRCFLAEATLPQCTGFDPVRRTWWRREDAD